MTMAELGRQLGSRTTSSNRPVVANIDQEELKRSIEPEGRFACGWLAGLLAVAAVVGAALFARRGVLLGAPLIGLAAPG